MNNPQILTQSPERGFNKTSQYGQRLIYKLKKVVFSTFPKMSEIEKNKFLSIVCEKEIDSEKLSEYIIRLKSMWTDILDLMLLSNNEICEYILYSFEYHNRQSIYNIKFTSLIGLLTNKKENVTVLEENFKSKCSTNKALNDILWVNFNSQKVFSQMKNQFFMDMIQYEKEIFQDQSIYININFISCEILEILKTFLLNHCEMIKVKLYISDEIQENLNGDLNDLLEKTFECIFIELGLTSELNYLSITVNSNLNYTLTEKNFALLKTAIKMNKQRLEILKIKGILMTSEQKMEFCHSIVEYTYFDNLKILYIDEKFEQSQMEKFDFYFKTSKNHLYFQINEIEITNFN